jgi:hypothetical protein
MFMQADPNEILGELSVRVSKIYSGNEAQQIYAWERELSIFRDAFSTLGDAALGWGVFLEMPLQRLRRRLDAVIDTGGAIVVVEFKIGAFSHESSDLQQVEDYALCMRDFHSGSRNREIIPILCSENAPAIEPLLSLNSLDLVSEVLHCNKMNLGRCLAFFLQENSGHKIPNWVEYDASSYNPTPSIVEAAKHVYAGHSVVEIGRTDASADILEAAASRLKKIALQAKKENSRVICFVSGTPGSGKTMLGLDLVFSEGAGCIGGEPAALLSGNRPLVHVLREALAEDAANRVGTKMEARRQVSQGLQNLLDYLKEHSHLDSGAPPEHVLVFDEAQRAWDAETGEKLLKRHRSEPALFFDILNRMPWACLVCLVGPGQEINRGEGGLPLWGQALEDVALEGNQWKVFAAHSTVHGGGDVGDGLLEGVQRKSLIQFIDEPKFHLSGGIRSYRTPSHSHWVASLLKGNISEAKEIALSMGSPPAYVTRSLVQLKCWLKARCRGNQRVGLLGSSGAVRLIADGLPSSPRSNELDQVAHWFLRPTGDYRSSNALEIPLSEFVSQGLEIDYVGLCWGGDLIWKDDKWQARAMRAPKWQVMRKEAAILYRLNSYRVLLTRARAGVAIYVPEGDQGDFTRSPQELNEIYLLLKSVGCTSIE